MTKKYETCGNIRAGVGQNNMGVWLWSVEVHTGEVYTALDEQPRFARKGEEVREEDKVWRTLASGREAVESFAWIAASGVMVGLSLVATTLVGQMSQHTGGASGLMRTVLKDVLPRLVDEVKS